MEYNLGPYEIAAIMKQLNTIRIKHWNSCPINKKKDDSDDEDAICDFCNTYDHNKNEILRKILPNSLEKTVIDYVSLADMPFVIQNQKFIYRFILQRIIKKKFDQQRKQN